ncbi:MAG: hydrogenase expression/formation protein HypE [Candidatus Saccharibacteria bacterium]
MKEERVVLAHGSGGRMSQQLIDEVFKKAWSNPQLDAMLDGAILDLHPGRVAVSTDSFVITPIFFPGGDIGKISICGTVNDLVACGAKPMALTVAMIIEEGLPLADLQKIVDSMARTAKDAGVQVVTGDTKVVEKGKADLIFITTSGLGVIPSGIEFTPARIASGDKVIVTGTVGDHGLAILAQREGLSFETPAVSDCAAMHRVGKVARSYESAIKCMRDPTRGGLATVLNELASQSGMGLLVRESDIPVSKVVQGACDMLGMDPLYMANEGKMVIIVAPEKADAVLEELKKLPEASKAAIIGEIMDDPAGMVLIETELGAQRILGMLEGEHLPRIC